MVDESTLKLSYIAASFFVASLFASWYRRDPLLEAIPTVGFSDPILSYFTGLRFMFDGLSMLKEGYEKNKPGLYKIALPRKWLVLTSGPELIEDLRKAPDDVLSSSAPVFEAIQAKYTLDLLDMNDDYHAHVIRTKLTRNIANTFKDVRDELLTAFDASIPVSGDGAWQVSSERCTLELVWKADWVKVPVVEVIQRVICATTNRVFVGSPLCRNQDYQTLNMKFAVNVFKLGSIIGMFPKPFRSIVSRMLSNLPSQIQQEIEFIRPMVEERFARMEEFGEDWDDKPNDMLMWLMSESKGVERSLEGVARRLLAVNFAAIDTTSHMLTIVLYRLISNPEYVESLRHEVETTVAEEGWTKAAMDKMHKIDSFIRETQRLDGVFHMTMTRLALRPFTFSNGVTVPAGTLLGVPSGLIHKDGEIYPSPDEFDGFRFAKLRERDGDAVAGHQAYSTSVDHVSFGYGRHACPGRFFVINEVKALLAHVVVAYDIKFEEGKQVPRSISFSALRIPARLHFLYIDLLYFVSDARVMYRLPLARRSLT